MEEEKKGFFAEFKTFIARGNVMDMAVGVIVGAAFKAIIDSLVNDILMPFVGIFVKTESFAELSVEVGGAVIRYGAFISAIINFLIIALVVFMIVRAINSWNARVEAAKKAKEAETAEEAEDEPAKPTQEELLADILEVLRERK